MSEVKDSKPASARVNQVYRSYLGTLFDLQYYRERHSETLGYARHFDFAIGLGTAISGGSGLGILADPRLAWVCGLVTTVSVILSVAKNSYDWSGKIRNSMEKIDDYSKLTSGYLSLVDDIQYRKEWNDDFEERYKKLRDQKANVRPFPFPHWDQAKLREIQNGVKSRVEYEDWWSFKR